MLRKCLAILVVSMLGGCTGHAVQITDSDGLNAAIDYLPWRSVEVADSDRFELKPGMELRVAALPVLPRGSNRRQVLPSDYRWVVPRAPDYGREDYFFLSTLIAMAERDDGSTEDLELHFQDLGDAIGETDDFHRALGEAVLAPLVRSLEVEYVPYRDDLDAAMSPQRIKQIVCSAGRGDFVEDRYARRLRAKFPAPDGSTVPLSLVGHDDWYFFAPIDPILPLERRSDWLSDNQLQGHRARAHIDVSIAVRFAGEVMPRLLSPCLTVGDLERQFGVHVNGIRRQAAQVPPALVSDRGLRPATLVANDRVTLAFAGAANPTGGASRVWLPGGQAVKDAVLVAHGDVILIAPISGD